MNTFMRRIEFSYESTVAMTLWLSIKENKKGSPTEKKTDAYII